MTERLINRREVERLTGLSRSSIYERMAAGTFPRARREPGERRGVGGVLLRTLEMVTSAE